MVKSLFSACWDFLRSVAIELDWLYLSPLQNGVGRWGESPLVITNPPASMIYPSIGLCGHFPHLSSGVFSEFIGVYMLIRAEMYRNQWEYAEISSEFSCSHQHMWLTICIFSHTVLPIQTGTYARCRINVYASELHLVLRNYVTQGLITIGGKCSSCGNYTGNWL